MIQHIPAAARYHAQQGWLETYWLFSFDQYMDPNNIRWGALRVFNDDVVQPGRGFPTHPHREYEIITIPLAGAITHTDSMGHRTTVSAGEVQRMSAGTGVEHAEYNLGEEPLHLYQIWITPREASLPPSYEQQRFDPAGWQHRLQPLVSGQGLPETVSMHADGTIYRGVFSPGESFAHPAGSDQRVFIYVTSGTLGVNEATLATGDQARITDEAPLQCEAIDACELILIDVPEVAG